jgi:hypothetical protein
MSKKSRHVIALRSTCTVIWANQLERRTRHASNTKCGCSNDALRWQALHQIRGVYSTNHPLFFHHRHFIPLLFLRISRGDTLKRGDITRYHDHTPLAMLLLPSHDPLNMQANQHKKAGQIVTGKVQELSGILSVIFATSKSLMKLRSSCGYLCRGKLWKWPTTR